MGNTKGAKLNLLAKIIIKSIFCHLAKELLWVAYNNKNIKLKFKQQYQSKEQ